MKRIFILFISIIFTIATSSNIFGIDPEQKRYLDSGALYVDLEACAPSSTTKPGGSTPEGSFARLPHISDPDKLAQTIDDYIAEKAPSSPMKGLGSSFVEGAIQAGINPLFAVAISQVESQFASTSDGWHATTPPSYNAMGRSATPSQPHTIYNGDRLVYKYESWEKSLVADAFPADGSTSQPDDWYQYMARRFKDQLDDIVSLMADYAPEEDGNDEQGYLENIFNISNEVAERSDGAIDLTQAGTPVSGSGSGACAPCPATASGGIDRFLQVLAYNESGGDPTIRTGGESSASGKYQYVIGTWRSNAQKYYPPALEYREARDAPENVQDALVYIEYTDVFKRFDGDIFKIAVNHFLPAANSDESLLDVKGGGDGFNPTPREYANSIIENMGESGPWDNIPLDYTSAPDFSTHLAAVGGESTGGSTSSGSAVCGSGLDGVECPANMEPHSSRAGYFKLPEAPSEEYIIYSREAARYGSQQLVCVLYSVGIAFHQQMGGRSKLRIGDLNASGHKSHNIGIAVDLSGVGELQVASHTDAWKGTYDKEATIMLGKLFADTEVLRNIWWCDPGDDSTEQILAYAETKGLEGQIKCVSGHSNHFHVDISQEYSLEFWEP